MSNAPHVIPYQGSKRKIAPIIAHFITPVEGSFYEPFCGSAAMTIYAAQHSLAKRFIIGDSLGELVRLQKSIIENPRKTASRYQELWEIGKATNVDYFYKVRERFNNERDPIDLLYLIARCVKNAIRFNSKGGFTQSVDKRRFGTQPKRMEKSIHYVSLLLKGKIEFRVGNWMDTLSDASSVDLVYLDPPYMGTSNGNDKRYHEQTSQETITNGMRSLLNKKLKVILSYDGRTGDKSYGPDLPDNLGLKRIYISAGKSAQATLSGKNEETFESLYLGNIKATEKKDTILSVNTMKDYIQPSLLT